MDKIIINLFFDGTLNNGNNALSKDKKKGDSYNQSLTNIFRLYKNSELVNKDATNNVYSIYIEGIGTMTKKKDADIVAGLGSLGWKKEYGGAAKIMYASDKTIEHIKYDFSKNKSNNDKKTSLKLEYNIFGFSRGGALALHYANQLANKESEHYKKICYELRWNFEIEEIIVNNIGLFDTVSQYHSNDGLVINSSVNNLTNVKNIFQFIANHECRENFPLTSILPKSKGEKLVDYIGQTSFIGCTKVSEITVPGSHSDIGGGYLDNIDEIVSISCERDEDKCKIDVDSILSVDKWTNIIKDGHIDVKHEPSADGIYYYAELKRTSIKGQLQLVYGKLMIEIANLNGCNFDLSSFNTSHTLSTDLDSLYTKLRNYILSDFGEKFELDNLNEGNSKYIHISSDWNVKRIDGKKADSTPIQKINITSQTVTEANINSLRIHRPANNWERKIIYQKD